MYVPQARLSDGLSALVASKMPTVWVIRTQGPAQISRAAQEALRTATGLPVTDVHTMEQLVTLSVSRQRLHMLLMTVFGGAALLLAAVGVFGLMAYAVAQRTQEIGIRLAMGGAPSSVGLMICRDGLRVIAIGLAAGLGAAFFLAKFLASTLFGVTAHDPAVFVAIPILLALVALAAIAIPALRASRLSPVDALRYPSSQRSETSSYSKPFPKIRSDVGGQLNAQLRFTCVSAPCLSTQFRVAFTAVVCRTQLGRLTFCAAVLAPTKLRSAMLVVGNAAPPPVIAHSLKVVVLAAPEPMPPDGVTTIGEALPLVA
jgi:hypothetical protein